MSFGYYDIDWVDPDDCCNVEPVWERDTHYYVRHTLVSDYNGELPVDEGYASEKWLRLWFEDAENHCEGQSVSFEVFATYCCNVMNDSYVDFDEPLFVKKW